MPVFSGSPQTLWSYCFNFVNWSVEQRGCRRNTAASQIATSRGFSSTFQFTEERLALGINKLLQMKTSKEAERRAKEPMEFFSMFTTPCKARDIHDAVGKGLGMVFKLLRLDQSIELALYISTKLSVLDGN